MRLPYISKDPDFTNAEDQAIVSRVKRRRGSTGLLELDRALLHAAPVADGWNSFLGSIRTGTSLPTSVREIVICRVAVLNRAWYEWEHHAPLFRAATGISDNDVTAVLDTAPRAVHVKVVDDKHNAAMAYADAMTLDISVPDDIFERLKYHFSDKEIVELTATVAAYNCVSRFLVALDVGEKNGHEEPGRLGQ